MFTRIMHKTSLNNVLSNGKKLVFQRNNSTSQGDSDVILESIKDAGIITLNRPKALNALNLSMIRAICPSLKSWEKEKCFVIIKGAGEKAFCAGGDVRAVVEAGLRKETLGQDFFREEYTLNALIGTYSIPYIALIDGITMGGGVGLSVHGQYRVATERTLFAMPETAIGFFPDVGGSYFLPRLGGKLGLYLGLTGHRLKGIDVLKAGVATHFCKSSMLCDLEEELLLCKNESDIDAVLCKFTKNSVGEKAEFSLTPHLKDIDECFSPPCIEEIIAKLNKKNNEWSQKACQLLSKMSPTSLKLTLKELELGASRDLPECLQMEFRMAMHILENKDFYEGVRALLIDKDQQPKWNPPNLETVTEEHISKYFEELSPDMELKL